MRNIRRAGILMVTAISAVLMIGVSPTGAQADLDCGDPGTSLNMPVDPNNDPHELDANDDGVGCEDPAAFDGGGGTPTPAPGPAPMPADPAEPQVREPDFTG
jgi:hypothetical protein